MRSSGLLIVAAVLVGGTGAEAQSLADLTIRGFGLPTVTPAIVACTDVPASAVPASTLRILAAQSPDLHEQFAAGETVVLTATQADGLSSGQRFFIRRVERRRDGEPITELTPGAIRTAGWLTVVSADAHSALARIDYVCDAARAGDYLEPFAEPTLARASGPDGPPRFDDPARVLIGKDRREEFGAGDIFSISRGTAQGVTAGARVVLYRDRLNGGPLVELGEGHVVAVDNDTARVLITRSSDGVRSGDLVTTRVSK